ncbi:MAG: TylF/MycF/NovP-related O-methyltransferase [Dehalococcoidia bacterium]
MSSVYLDMVKRTLCNLVYEDQPFWAQRPGGPMVALPPFDPRIRTLGQDAPSLAHTMVGWQRLTNIEWCGSEVIEQDIPGDFVETGVARGGAAIFMRAVLRAHGVTDRRVIACDTFEGFPEPPSGAVQRGVARVVLKGVSLLTRVPSRRWQMALYRWIEARQRSFPPSVDPSPEIIDTWMGMIRFYADHPSFFEKDQYSLRAVRSHFARYGLLDSQVLFLQGFFADTLPRTPIDSIAVLRLDGDTYESTRSVLDLLYDKVSPGGYVIIDDYLTFSDCKRAVDGFRSERGIMDAIVEIDECGVYWKKS